MTTLRRDAAFARYLVRVWPWAAAVANDVAKPGVTELAYDRVPLKAFVSLTELWDLVRGDLARVDQPVLLYRSAADHVVEPVNARLVLDGISSTDATEVVLPDSYHVATLDHDAPTIFEGSTAFVRRVDAARSPRRRLRHVRPDHRIDRREPRMSSPDPEDTPRPETPRGSDDARPPGSADARRFELPEDVDAAFAAIVAEWAGTDAPRWPQDPTEDGPSSGVGLATPPQGQPEAHPERRTEDLFTDRPDGAGAALPRRPATPAGAGTRRRRPRSRPPRP